MTVGRAERRRQAARACAAAHPVKAVLPPDIGEAWGKWEVICRCGVMGFGVTLDRAVDAHVQHVAEAVAAALERFER